jgi:signal recognition particle receptor subunit beta
VKSVLERELEKRRTAQIKGINIEGLGEEGERTDMGGLECGEKEGSSFKFDEWEGGEILFLGTSTVQNELDDKGSQESDTESLLGWLNNAM